MRGRKIQAVFLAFSLLVGLSCALNPQPEPPGAFENGTDVPGSSQAGGGIPIVSADAAVIADPNGNADASVGSSKQDSSTSSDSSADGGTSDAAPEGGDEGGDSATDEGADASEVSLTTVD